MTDNEKRSARHAAARAFIRALVDRQFDGSVHSAAKALGVPFRIEDGGAK